MSFADYDNLIIKKCFSSDVQFLNYVQYLSLSFYQVITRDLPKRVFSGKCAYVFIESKLGPIF